MGSRPAIHGPHGFTLSDGSWNGESGWGCLHYHFFSWRRYILCICTHLQLDFSWYDGKGPGKFTLAVDNKKLPVVLGDEGKQWMWQPAGTVSVKAGSSSLTLKDLTGFNGRCDAIYFTTEKGQLLPLRPPHNWQISVKMLDIPAEPSNTLWCDCNWWRYSRHVCSRNRFQIGMQVALINDRPVLGGNNSSEVRVT